MLVTVAVVALPPYPYLYWPVVSIYSAVKVMLAESARRQNFVGLSLLAAVILSEVYGSLHSLAGLSVVSEVQWLLFVLQLPLVLLQVGCLWFMRPAWASGRRTSPS